MLYSITNKSSLRCELKIIKKIHEKYSKKSCNYSRDSSNDDLDSNSSLTSNGRWDTYRLPDGRKETNRLDNIVTNNLKTTKYQLNKPIKNEPTFDNNIFNLSSGSIDPLSVVTITLQVGK